jgi:hypothetical protein
MQLSDCADGLMTCVKRMTVLSDNIVAVVVGAWLVATLWVCLSGCVQIGQSKGASLLVALRALSERV